MPNEQRRYLSANGWHFNKKLYDWAVSKMRDRNGGKVETQTKDDVDAFLKANGVELKHDVLYDAPYVLAMRRADEFGSSIEDDRHLALSVKDYLDDVDGSETRAMDEFIGKCIGAGCPIPWEDVL